MEIAAAGDRAFLVTLPGVSSARLRAVAERVRGVGGVVAAIVGHESLYVIGSKDAEAIQRVVGESNATAEHAVERHLIEVSFHGQHALDLSDFLEHVQLTGEEFLKRVSSIRLTVRYLGFRAGFAYLDGWPAAWSMPRRPTSRNLVPGGSFGIAGSMAGFYPVDSPGGWNILGRTAGRLWDAQRHPPNLLAPGDEIVIEPNEQRLVIEPAPPLRIEPEGAPIAEVIAPGQLTIIVGEPDWTRLEHGLPPGGPFDEEAAAMANAAIGNDPRAPLLECVLVGPKLRFREARRVAWCDGELSLRIWDSPAEIEIGRIGGMRGYLAIEGGINPMRLRYAEALTVVKRGDSLWSAVPWHRFSCGGQPPRLSGQRRAAVLHKAAASRSTPKAIRVVRGPHHAPPLPEEWEVTPQLDRVGVRLRPLQAIDAKLPADLPSCGAQFGTLQWHADGTIVALGPDHPVTGGYLQPATIIAADRWKLAQLAPGDRVRLTMTE